MVNIVVVVVRDNSVMVVDNSDKHSVAVVAVDRVDNLVLAVAVVMVDIVVVVVHNNLDKFHFD